MKKAKLKNYLKTGILYVALPFLLCNCESGNTDSLEGQQSSIETVPLNEALSFFNAKTVSGTAKSNESYVTPHLEHITQEEITNSNALLTVIPGTTVYKAHYSRILLLKVNNEIQSLVFSMHASGDASEYFSGEIIITDLDGNFVNGYRVANGLITTQFKKINTAAKASAASKNSNAVCPDHGECTEGSNCVLCLQELEEVVVGGGSGNTGEQIQYVDLNDFPGIDEGGADGPDMGLDWDYGPGEGSSPDNNNAEENISIDPDFSNDYPCQSQMVQEIYANCAPLSQLFQDIFEGNATFNVTFTAEDLNDIFRGAQTHGGVPNNYTIKLNTERLDQSTELDLINNTTHEYVHAIVLHHYYQGAFQLTGAGNPPTYAELAEGFAQHRADFYSEANQHEYMASLVQDIAEVTYTWATAHGGYDPNDFAAYDTDPGDAIDGLKAFLRQLAWNGLTGTTAFQDLYPKDSPEELQIKKTIQDEAFPNDADASPKGDLPAPCN